VLICHFQAVNQVKIRLMEETPMKKDHAIGRLINVFATLTSLLSLMLLATLPAPAQEVQTDAQVINEDYHDTSVPVRELAPLVPLGSSQQIVLPLRRKPGLPVVSPEPDAVTQDIQEIQMVGTTNKLNFDGVSDRDGVAPPDTNASVGSTQVVETVNTSYKVFNKSTGASVFGPAEISSIFTGVPGACGLGLNGFYTDPIVEYDKAAGRWLVTILASPDGGATGVECIAVSGTSNATGSYHRYAFSFGTNNLNDYPKFGVWPDAYYASYNMFNGLTGFFTGARVCAYQRSAMLAGTTAKSICFQRSVASRDFSFLPSDMDGSGIGSTGEPNFFVELGETCGTTCNLLDLFKFHVDFTTPSHSTFTGPTALTVATFTLACGGGTCIPQTGTSQRLDSLGDRLMFRLAYRRFTGTGAHEALVATHSVRTGSAASGARWYEIRNPNGTPIVFQQGTVSSGSTALWMSSIGMDKVGDIAVGFSESSSSIHPKIAYTGRVPTDPSGTMESIDVVFSGVGSQTGGLSRWGDYTSISVDPSDDCTFWYANEYIPSNGSFNWHTRLNSFKFTGCI